MRRLALLVVLAGLGLVAPTAQASFHLQTVNEVMTAGAAGTSGVQFVELLDHGGAEETFPAADGPFGLAVYDAGGTRLGSQALSGAGMAAHSVGDTPYLVSTAAADTALGVKGDAALTVALPTTAGQACYTAMGGTPYSCVTWGCVTKAVQAQGFSGSVSGAPPPAGSSAQVRSGGGLATAAPTPGAGNATGPKTTACPGSGTKPPPFQGAHSAAKQVSVSKGRAAVRLACPKAGTNGACHGRVTLRWGKRHRKAGSATFRIAAGQARSVSVKLAKDALAAYKPHDRLTVAATIDARDGRNRHKVRHATLNLRAAPRHHAKKKAPAPAPPAGYPY